MLFLDRFEHLFVEWYPIEPIEPNSSICCIQMLFKLPVIIRPELIDNILFHNAR